MIEVICEGVRPAHVLELAAQFEAVCREDIKLEVFVSGSQVTARAGGAVFPHATKSLPRGKAGGLPGAAAATGISLDWGCLTGVKPLKLMQRMLADGLDSDRACEEMRLKYELGPNKCALLRETAENQRACFIRRAAWRAVYQHTALPDEMRLLFLPSSVTCEGSALSAQYLTRCYMNSKTSTPMRNRPGFAMIRSTSAGNAEHFFRAPDRTASARGRLLCAGRA